MSPGSKMEKARMARINAALTKQIDFLRPKMDDLSFSLGVHQDLLKLANERIVELEAELAVARCKICVDECSGVCRLVRGKSRQE